MTWRPRLGNKPFKVMSMDPGETNFFYTITHDQQVICSGNFKKTFKKIEQKPINEFVDEVWNIFNKHKPDVVVLERWMIRTFLAKISETINRMIGVIDTNCSIRGIEYQNVTASSWKISIKKLLDLKELYKYAKKQHKLPPHAVDSMLINRYYLSGNNFRSSDKEWIYRNLPNLKKECDV